MFEVSYGEEMQTFETRIQAIAAAKDLSNDNRGVVSITDESRRERMTYQGGELISYDYETRRN
ncbi:MAG: hypothetical protein R3F39_23915 [Myxococcota bacterium]|jgi:hypothetical protein